MITVLIFILILSVLVLVHELGHFITAKKFGIKVEEFGFGLPPRAWGKKIGETIYSINWLPIGGFVKLYGEDEAGGGRINSKLKMASRKQNSKFKDADRTFFGRPVWQRAIVVVAGVVMNFILAVLIISFLLSFVGVNQPEEKVRITAVVAGSPAEKAGIKTGDIVVSIDDTSVKDPQQLVNLTKEKAGKKINITLESKGIIETVTITPRKISPNGEGPMGVAIAQNFKVVKVPWYRAPFEATAEALNDSWMIVTGLGTVIYQLFTQGAVPKEVAGPVGIAQLTGQFVQIGPFAVLSLVSLLSLNLAVLNVLPIPALDGGRLFFILIEGVTRRKVNARIEGYAHGIGMIVLLALILLITLHDLVRIFTGQPILPKIQ